MDFKPHRSQYWLNHQIENEVVFREKVREVCKLYHQAQERHEQGVHVVSVDEKTGIQVLERIHPTRPMEPGQVEAIELEYERHGTQAWIANFEVATGQVICPSVGDTRTEEDVVVHINATLESDPQGEWIFICDPLNTYKSESRVRAVTEACGIKEGWGKKGQSDILRNTATRSAFLQDTSHRTHFVYMPKHGSWLNQVEIGFGMLTRSLLKRGTLAQRMRSSGAFLPSLSSSTKIWPSRFVGPLSVSRYWHELSGLFPG